jgi:hypothetical protein
MKIQESVPSLHHHMEHTTSTTVSCLGDSNKANGYYKIRIRITRRVKLHLNQDEPNHYDSVARQQVGESL